MRENLKRIFKLLFLISVATFQLATSPHAQAVPAEAGLKSWSGLRLITLGTYYILEVTKGAETWVKTDESSIFANMMADDVQKMSKTLQNGFSSSGKVLVLLGIAKEYYSIYDYKDDPTNPLNQRTPERVKRYQDIRLGLLEKYLNPLVEGLKANNLDAGWLTQLFDAKSGELTQTSLGAGLAKFGWLVDKFHIYGVGIELVSDFPVGSLVTIALSKWLPERAQALGETVSYQQMQGIVYFVKQEGEDESKFAASSLEQESLRAQASVLAKGQSHTTAELNFTVRLTFMTSSSVLANFNELNLNNTMISELTMKNSLSNTLPTPIQGIVKKSIEALDKSSNFPFLRENVRLAFGHVQSFSSVQSVVENTPDLLIRFAVGNYGKEIDAGKGFTGWLEPSLSFGKLSVGKTEN